MHLHGRSSRYAVFCILCIPRFDVVAAHPTSDTFWLTTCFIVRRLQSSPVTLYEAARVSVLHASMMEYLLRLAHARYSLLAQWPDFTTMMGKDYYYRFGCCYRYFNGAVL
jgi:hypothetical protein